MHLDLESGGAGPDPGQILVARARVDHGAVPARVEEIDDQIVDDAGVFPEHAAVERLARLREPCHVVRQQQAQKFAHPRTAQVDHAHVRDIEHARRASHRQVLFDLRPVIDGHVPTTEVNDARTAREVQIV